MTTSEQPPVFADQTAWRVARGKLLEREKQLTRQLDELAGARRELPWLEVAENYVFECPDGRVTLTDLFGGKSQLVVYHFMYGEDWDDGCPSCSFWADNFNGVDTHLAARDTAFVCVSNVTLAQIRSYRDRMGWDFEWVSAAGTTFSADLGVSPPANASGEKKWDYNYGSISVEASEMPGLSVFARTEDGHVALTYQAFARGLEALNGAYGILDLTPAGRAESDLPGPQAWVRRHDEYAAADS